MPKITVDEELCKGCGLCTTACPQKIVALCAEKLNSKGYHPAHAVEMDKCTGCAMCALMCPDVAITVER